MKKTIVLCMALLVIAGSAGAQEKNALFVDLGYPLVGLIYGGFGIGGGYERALLPQVSVYGNAGYVGFTLEDLDYLGFDVSAGLRYYPMSNAVRGFYIGGLAGVSPITMSYSGDRTISFPVTVAGLVGWKGIVAGGFFWEPYVGYRWVFGEMKLPAGVGQTDYDLEGLTFGIGIGWAF
jgi:hypothetical protein